MQPPQDETLNDRDGRSVLPAPVEAKLGDQPGKAMFAGTEAGHGAGWYGSLRNAAVAISRLLLPDMFESALERPSSDTNTGH